MAGLQEMILPRRNPTRRRVSFGRRVAARETEKEIFNPVIDFPNAPEGAGSNQDLGPPVGSPTPRGGLAHRLLQPRAHASRRLGCDRTGVPSSALTTKPNTGPSSF